MHLLGFRFAPRIRDLADKRLYIDGPAKRYPTLAPLIGGTIHLKHIRAQWDEVLRPAGSIRQGTVTASLMLRKLGSYPRQNGLPVALRELGRIERTLFTLEWLQNVELRRRVHVGLNKGEARNARRLLQPTGEAARPKLREPAAPGFGAQPGGRRHRAVEHRLLGAGRERATRARPPVG